MATLTNNISFSIFFCFYLAIIANGISVSVIMLKPMLFYCFNNKVQNKKSSEYKTKEFLKNLIYYAETIFQSMAYYIEMILI